jgi:hypothetical protein
MLIQFMVAEHFREPAILDFKCLNHFESAVLRTHDLSFRRPQAAKRPEIDDEEDTRFMITFPKPAQHFPEENNINFDEPNWRRIMASDQVTGQHGAEGVRNYTDADGKADFSFFTLICADSTKLPLTLVARGRNGLSHQQFGDQVAEPYQIWHSPRGWSTEDLMQCFVIWTGRVKNCQLR